MRYRTCNARTLKTILYLPFPHRSMNSDPLTTAVMVKESMLKPLETTHSQMNCTPWPNPSPDPSPELLIEMSKNVTFNPGVGGDENSFPSINPDVVLSRSISPIWLCACMVLSTFTAPPRRERECLVVQRLFNHLTPQTDHRFPLNNIFFFQEDRFPICIIQLTFPGGSRTLYAAWRLFPGLEVCYTLPTQYVKCGRSTSR